MFNETVSWLTSLNQIINPADLFDIHSHSVKTLSLSECAINEELFFESFVKFSIVAGANYKVAIITPATKLIHWIPTKIVTTGPKFTIGFYKNQTYNDGTLLVPSNHDLRSLITPTLQLKSDVTCTISGDPFTQFFLGGGTGVGQSRSGAESSLTNKWILEPNKVYIMNINNGGDATEIVQVNNSWIEEAL